MRPNTDTIAAVATAAGDGALSVVRVSGPAAFAVADGVFRCAGAPPSARPSHSAVHGQILDESGDIIDDALLVTMRGPHSYTGEDVVEFQCHGGRVTPSRVLRRLLAADCRLAEPGEFTRRAFLNGRMDLSQAEAVCDLIRARSEQAASLALEQLSGRFGHRIASAYDRLVSIRARVEASLDFPDEDLPSLDFAGIRIELSALSDELRTLAATARGGRLLRDGAKVVIMGLPNVGKSSLFNALLGFNRSIVFHAPGTTRDTIEEFLELDGLPIRLVDTAGLRDASCEVEAEGVRRAEAEIATADIRILVVDVSLSPHEKELASLNVPSMPPLIMVRNKCDLPPCQAWDRVCSDRRCVSMSSVYNVGTEQLAKEIEDAIRAVPGVSGVAGYAVSERHSCLLSSAADDMTVAIDMLSSPQTDYPVVALHLRNAMEALGRIVGRDADADLLDSIFSKFCIGK